MAPADTLRRFAQAEPEDLVVRERRDRMDEAIDRVAAAFRTLGRDFWSRDVKASEQVSPPIFQNYYALQGAHNVMAKADYHQLADYLTMDRVEREGASVLDGIVTCLGAP